MMRTHIVALGVVMVVPAALQAQATTPTAPTAVATPIVGGTILDSAGATIGTVESITPQAIVINTGTAKIAVPPASVGKTATGFSMSMTKADLMAAQAQQQAEAGAAVKAKLVAGTPVVGLNGSLLGTIKSADATTVTMTTAKNIDVKLPVSGFGAGPTGGIVLGMTAAQLDAATAGATPSRSPAPAAAGISTADGTTGADTTTTDTTATPATRSAIRTSVSTTTKTKVTATKAKRTRR